MKAFSPPFKRCIDGLLIALMVFVLAGCGEGSRDLPTRPKTVKIVDADSGTVTEMPYAQAQEIGDFLRGDNPEQKPVDVPICPQTGKPYTQLVFVSCPKTNKLFAIAIGKPATDINQALIEKLSPFKDEAGK